MLRINKKEEKLSAEQIMEYHDSKSILAKILAGEDLELVHDSNARTAYIDLEARKVCIPMWGNMTASVYDLFLAHEVSHALHTPADGYHGQGEFPAGFRSFLNVTEDSRIERLMIKKYPGLRALFSRAYSTLHEEDFFGLEEGKPIQDRLFIDRLNLHTKLNSMNRQIFIEFNDIEQGFIDRLGTCDTFDQILEITQEIYDYCKQEHEEKRQEEEEEQNSYDQDTIDESQSDNENEYDIEEESYEDDYEEDTDDEDVDQSYQQSEEDYDEEDEEIISDTSENEQRSIERFTVTDSVTNVYNVNYDQRLFSKEAGNIRHVKLKDYCDDIVDILEKGEQAVHTITNHVSETSREWDYELSEAQKDVLAGRNLVYYNNFLKDNNSTINTMVQGFMRKKSASNYYRNTESKTGVLNMSKLHGYKYNEDLFKKVINNFDGDNYGMVFLLDQSGSMLGSSYKEVLEQLLILVEFCRRVQMPYKVVSFTTNDRSMFDDHSKQHDIFRSKIGQSVVCSRVSDDSVVNLNEFLNSTDNSRAHKKMVNVMLAGLLGQARYYQYHRDQIDGDKLVHVNIAGDRYLNRWGGDKIRQYIDTVDDSDQVIEEYARYLTFTSMFEFGGTPLNASLLTARGIIMDFKKSTNVEKVTFVSLTDGGNTNPLCIQDVAKNDNIEEGYHLKRHGSDYASSGNDIINLKIDDNTYKINVGKIYGYDQDKLLIPFFDIPWLNTVRIHLNARSVTSGTFQKAFYRDHYLNREITSTEKKMRCVIAKKGECSRMTLYDKEIFMYGIKDTELDVQLDNTKKVTKASLGKVLNSVNLKSSRKKMLANSYIDTITV